MKLKALFVAMSLASSAAMANDYNTQVDLDYYDYDSFNATSITGTYYFDQVSLDSTAWGDAAFMGKNSNVSLNYTDLDGDYNTITLRGEFYGQGSNNFYGALGYTDIDGDDSVVSGEVGYFFEDNWLMSIETTDEDDSLIWLKTKYITKLSSGGFFNVEASIDDEENDVAVKGEYFWNPQSSVALTLASHEGFDYRIDFEHFFNKQFALKVGYTATDGDDVIMAGLTGRF
ncbi:putative porin [Aliikangiella sp. G2MR2-5]|uniref:putative porin n=1 Tax=Aliikangiella sp. G2MR2-5 TaxID=2788943 RepID=UPI0018AA8517|nr:putative porin [Aliikangiella sp. G2MR2-5]